MAKSKTKKKTKKKTKTEAKGKPKPKAKPKPKPKSKTKPKTKTKTVGASAGPRPDGQRVRVYNSGLEVWLYDNANLKRIQESNADASGFGAMPGGFEDLTRLGLIVGYSLVQDDELDVGVYVGKAFTKTELSSARWLEPQTAFLQLPSGRLCIESNDASRVGPDSPTDKGAKVAVPPGDYRLTLYRVDDEALDRDGIEWRGPREIILLTPGGTKKDAASDLLSFEPRRDLSWVGKYTTRVKGADALVWLGDYWDTFLLNLDQAAAQKISLSPGCYLRTEVPAAKLTLITAFANSWDEAKRLATPSGVDLSEYGFGSFCAMSEWNGAEAIFCRRDTAKTKVEDKHQKIWLPARVEVLPPESRPAETKSGGFRPVVLAEKNLFDPGFLALVLSDVLPNVADRDELELKEAVKMLDRKLEKMALSPKGDVAWTQKVRTRQADLVARFYTGPEHSFAAIVAGEGSFELVFISELKDERWVVTGLADVLQLLVERSGPTGLPEPHPRVALENVDEALEDIWKAHQKNLERSKSQPAAAPQTLDDSIERLDRFYAVALS